MAEAMTTVAKTVPPTVTRSMLEQVSVAIPHWQGVAQAFTPLLSDQDALWPWFALGRVAEGQNRWGDAEKAYQACLTMTKQRFGSEYPNTATSLNNLALLYRAMGRYPEAEPLYVRAIAIWTETLGQDHPHTQQGLKNFRSCVSKAWQAGRAEELSNHPITQAILELIKQQGL